MLKDEKLESDSVIPTWQTMLESEKQKTYFLDIQNFLVQEKSKGKIIYPENKNIYNALKLTAFVNVKVVIIGQDPYHGPNQAHGLSFSVPKGIPQPPSLQNIFIELKKDLNITPPSHGCLEKWATQGVLLLNAVLTVEANKPQSHANIGWQTFTDQVILSLNHHPQKIVYLLWGSYAQRKSELIDRSKHLILTASHPSPLSAYRGFMGCRHFSRANDFLIKLNRDPIDWSI